jgi:hypothetical protein
MDTITKHIRIVGLPPGEAPIEIRQAWIGLELPLADGKYQKERSIRGLGVLSGPKSFFGLFFAWIFRQGDPTKNFVVQSAKALEILEEERPEAAEWWKENVPHFYKPWMLFAFSSDICEEVGPE